MPEWLTGEFHLFGLLPVQNWMLVLAGALAAYGMVLALMRWKAGH